MIDTDFIPGIHNVLTGYRNGSFTPRELITYLQHRAKQYDDRNIWISTIDGELLDRLLQKLEDQDIDSLPLYGVPFAVKDNIDVAGFATTAGCPEYSYQPQRNAHLIEKLIEAGAVPLGKTNLDQFATGLVGTRSPYGPCKNSINPDYISGGSSAGSAVAVALGLVSFSLGTDTAGSGRVPAMLNNIVGLKPSRGLFSMSGVVPACRTLDCPSVFALHADDAVSVFNVAASVDDLDDYSRANPIENRIRSYGQTYKTTVVGVPFDSQLEFFGCEESKQIFSDSVDRWRQMGATVVAVDIEPLLHAARLLYEGPWVAERYAAIQHVMETRAEVVHPVVRGIVDGAKSKSAVETFTAEYKMQSYRAAAKILFKQIDLLLTPTAPRHYLIDQVLNDPVQLNSNMGYYTNFMNLLDLCGVAVPAGVKQDGMPFGITLAAPALKDVYLLNQARVWQEQLGLNAGAMTRPAVTAAAPVPSLLSKRQIDIAVCGAHLDGCPLNWQLLERGATLKRCTITSANYRLYLLPDAPPERPGLLRNESDGVGIEVEVWSMPTNALGGFVNNIPYPLGIGKVELDNGEWISGFMCEASAVASATDISVHGSWRKFQASK